MSACVAIAGVTGAVGQEFLQVLEQRGFQADRYKMLASARSAGREVSFNGTTYAVEEMTPESFADVDIALFSCGGSQSKQFAPLAARQDCVVVDNSSAFRMDPKVPLVVPEINADAIRDHEGIIANPNCSTIIMAVPVFPLHQAFGVKRMVVSTYQAVSGAGAQAMEELKTQTQATLNGEEVEPVKFKYPCAFNVFSHDSDLQENGYNTEEMKMVHETHKIFSDDSIGVTCTCIRVPVLRAHCESINLEFNQSVDLDEVIDVLLRAPGVSLIDDRENNRFPMPLDATDEDDVYVGRIRYDESIPNNRAINLWVAGDQIRKGAALNAVQIAEKLL